MSTKRCNWCLSSDLRESRLTSWEAYLAWLVRPVRCYHCQHRQYVAGSPFVDRVIDTFRRVDDGINQLHPEAVRRFLKRRDADPAPAEPHADSK